MNERQLVRWKNRVKLGGAYELEGAFGDSVFVPRTTSDVDPVGARLRNRLMLQQIRELIDHNKLYGGQRYA